MSEPGAPPPRSTFSLRLISGRLPMKAEGVVAACVIGAVFGVAFIVFNMPGPLVVQVVDDKNQPVIEARVRCGDPLGEKTFAGSTDVFGEAKWPGLARGAWHCEVWPPARYFTDKLEGSAVVVPRAPAVVQVKVERAARLLVEVKRPPHAPRAALAVRAICPAERGQPLASWETRTSAVDGRARLWLPTGRACRVGLVRPELAADSSGPVTQAVIDCEKLPCTQELSGGVGASLEAELAPTLEQWLEVRPAIEPDAPEPAPPTVVPAPKR